MDHHNMIMNDITTEIIENDNIENALNLQEELDESVDDLVQNENLTGFENIPQPRTQPTLEGTFAIRTENTN